MEIAIIGTGNVGKALASSFRKASHHVTLAARDVKKTQAVAEELGVEWAANVADAASTAEVVVLAVPFTQLLSTARSLRTATDGKVVIDTTNPIKADYSGLATDGQPSAAEQLAAALPNAGVVKAFNTMFSSVHADARALGTTVDAFFATDDDGARTLMAELLESIDLRAIDVGPLNAARQLESLAWLNIRIQMQSDGDWRSAFVLVGAPPKSIAA